MYIQGFNGADASAAHILLDWLHTRLFSNLDDFSKWVTTVLGALIIKNLVYSRSRNFWDQMWLKAEAGEFLCPVGYFSAKPKSITRVNISET